MRLVVRTVVRLLAILMPITAMAQSLLRTALVIAMVPA